LIVENLKDIEYIHAIGSAILSSSAGVLGFLILGLIVMPERKEKEL